MQDIQYANGQFLCTTDKVVKISEQSASYGFILMDSELLKFKALNVEFFETWKSIKNEK